MPSIDEDAIAQTRWLAARALAITLSELCERYWGASWIAGGEHEVWEAMKPGGNVPPSRLLLGPDDIALFHWLSAQADGWTDGDLEDPLIPMTIWLSQHDRNWRSRQPGQE